MKREQIDKLQLEKLKEAAKIFLKPMERLPFPVVIEAMTGRQVIPYIEEDDGELMAALAGSCIKTVNDSEKTPVEANRPNDVSTKVEKMLQGNLSDSGITAERPKPQGKQRASAQGYPDLLLWDADRPTYLEVKVSRVENISKGSARNFFYQPTKNSKIAHPARHLLCGFSIEEAGEKMWVLREWTVTDLWFLRVKLKPEYNADNLEIYRREAVILKGDGKNITTPQSAARDKTPPNHL
ncbi:MAG: hypothetical protein OXU88_05970 [Gammaproteobacteria bacterium]|nr:hypothetical protein [Gammaproteobacteria bacterium]